MNDDLFRAPPAAVETRWASPENPLGGRSAAATVRGGRKGSPSLSLAAGESVTLAFEPSGVSGTVRRIWMTISDRSPAMLRGLRLDFFWDGARIPAVSAPLGDFFGVGLGRMAAFESALFASPEARSFNCIAPMPFRSGLRLVVTNETTVDLPMLFYEVNYTVGEPHEADTWYFHAHFRRENPTILQRDYELLPPVTGRGRFLGVNIGVRANTERYGRSWWGEGEVKCYRDGDTDHPTLCGTGTEDYIGTAWAQGQFAHAYQGCPVADDAAMAYCFYRYHVPDPIWFHQSLRVTIQQIGHCFGANREWLHQQDKTVYRAGPGLVPADLSTDGESGILFERQDDWSSCAYLYLDRPENNLPPLAPVAERTAGA
ncbi:MAG: DUF2961 domain-containing protein [Cytophagales bacterium]|nr:DUF2961 domain-containing protein [Armatimonadota bacterium]